MIKFFRKIRYGLMKENKMSKYFKYAIGEILLVVIGILIALQVSNWNDNRKKTNMLYNYYTKLSEEAAQNSTKTHQFIKSWDSLIKQQKRTLKILKTKNEDSIPKLKENIGAVATAWYIDFSFTVFDEFIQKGLISEIKNQELKQNLLDLKLQLTNFEGNNSYAENQYNTLIEPFFAKHINYSTNAMLRYRKDFVEGGPKTDFNTLFNSMELWNITTFKLETTNISKARLLDFLKLLEELKQNLDKKSNISPKK